MSGSASITQTSAPACASPSAVMKPVGPPPTTITSCIAFSGLSPGACLPQRRLACKGSFAAAPARLAVTNVRITTTWESGRVALAELDETSAARGGSYRIRGRFEPDFEPAVHAFIENFEVEEELGAATSAVLDGETVGELWGGWANADRSKEWDEHSTVCMMSVAKGVTGICFNKVVEQGLVDIDRPVAHYWPEFAQNGKEDILVRWCLDHRAGIPVLTDDTMYPGGFFDYPAYIKALEAQHPLWQPGTRAAYHVHNQGFLLAEIMHRVTGMTVGPFLKENVTEPLHAEYYIGGKDEQQQAHVAEVLPNTGARLFAAKDQAIPDKPTTPEGWQDGAVLRSFAILQNPLVL